MGAFLSTREHPELVYLALVLHLTSAWISLHPPCPPQWRKQTPCLRAVGLDVLAASGLQPETEWPVIRDILANSVDELEYSDTNMKFFPAASSIPGATGRVLCLRAIGMTLDEMEAFEDHICFSIDENIYSESPVIRDPTIVSFQDVFDVDNLSSLVLEKANNYELVCPVSEPVTKYDEGCFVPSQVIEVDGAFIKEPYSDEKVWDTSTAMVFDHLVSEDLRSRLLRVVLSDSDRTWDDQNQGPDPVRWERGGLMDIPGQEGECWGLTDEAIEDICFNTHESINEMEVILSQLFSSYHVTRLPEAVMGAAVSPLTANAPTFGDCFSFHIDADPNLAPPSPWTDVFGRYPNRSCGKPRFVSALIYLNDVWDEEEWGAATRLLDYASGKFQDILPKPGRLLVIDQDLSHSVTAPLEAAGNRPRYSLVWKLVLHPKHAKQDMRKLNCGRVWPQAVVLGSADRR